MKGELIVIFLLVLGIFVFSLYLVPAQECIQRDHTACYFGNVYWSDSCNNIEPDGIKEVCNSGCDYDLGECSLNCQENFRKVCYYGNIMWIDSCKMLQNEIVEDCQYGCVNGACLLEQSSLLQADYSIIDFGGSNYGLYLDPFYPDVDRSEIYITSGFNLIGEGGGVNRVKSWSNHPLNAYPTEFDFDSNIDSYLIGEISKNDFSVFNQLYIHLEYSGEEIEWEIPLDSVGIEIIENIAPTDEPISLPTGAISRKDLNLERGDSKISFICSGCLSEDKCYPFGFRKDGDFCSGQQEDFVLQLREDSTCENNFECSSNVCVANQCISESLLQKIIDWFKGLLG